LIEKAVVEFEPMTEDRRNLHPLEDLIVEFTETEELWRRVEETQNRFERRFARFLEETGDTPKGSKSSTLLSSIDYVSPITIPLRVAYGIGAVTAALPHEPIVANFRSQIRREMENDIEPIRFADVGVTLPTLDHGYTPKITRLIGRPVALYRINYILKDDLDIKRAVEQSLVFPYKWSPAAGEVWIGHKWKPGFIPIEK